MTCRLFEIVAAFDRGCEHKNIVESCRYANGDIDGRCTDCGEEGFVIRDTGYEKFLQSDKTEVDLAEWMTTQRSVRGGQ